MKKLTILWEYRYRIPKTNAKIHYDGICQSMAKDELWKIYQYQCLIWYLWFMIINTPNWWLKSIMENKDTIKMSYSKDDNSYCEKYCLCGSQIKLNKLNYFMDSLIHTILLDAGYCEQDYPYILRKKLVELYYGVFNIRF